MSRNILNSIFWSFPRKSDFLYFPSQQLNIKVPNHLCTKISRLVTQLSQSKFPSKTVRYGNVCVCDKLSNYQIFTSLQPTKLESSNKLHCTSFIIWSANPRKNFLEPNFITKVHRYLQISADVWTKAFWNQKVLCMFELANIVCPTDKLWDFRPHPLNGYDTDGTFNTRHRTGPFLRGTLIVKVV
jgi:hypothetical protein